MKSVCIEKRGSKFVLQPYNIEADSITVRYQGDKVKILIETDTDQILSSKSRIHLFKIDPKYIEFSRSKTYAEPDEKLSDTIEIREVNKGEVVLTIYGHYVQLIKRRPFTILDLKTKKELLISPDAMVSRIGDIGELKDGVLDNIDLPDDESKPKLKEKLDTTKYGSYVPYKEIEKGDVGLDARTKRKVQLVKLRPYMVRDIESEEEWIISSTEDLVYMGDLDGDEE